jgi:type I restriction enzyme S subunit
MKQLHEIVKIFKGGKAPEVFDKPKQGANRYIQIEDLRPDATLKYAIDKDGALAKKTDVLIAWDGANAGTVGFDLEGYIGSTLAILRPTHDDIHAPYLGYFLRSKFDEIQENTTGAAIPHINRDHLENLQLPIPPLPEQRRIADLLARADRLRRLRRTARQLGDTYLQSVFLEMFGDPVRNQKGWNVVTLGEKLNFITSGSRGWAEYYSDKGNIFLRVQNVGANQLLLDDVAYVQAPDTTESRRTRVQSGDLLISATADIGRTAVIPKNFPIAYINQHLFLLRLKDLNPVFIAGYFATPKGRGQILKLNREGVKSGLNFDDARSLKVFNPPLAEQARFAAMVNRYERLRSQQRESERQAEHLFQSLLREAFRGEL